MNKLKSIFEENNALNQYNQILFKYKLNTFILALLTLTFCTIKILYNYDDCDGKYIFITNIFLLFYLIYTLAPYIHLYHIAKHQKFITSSPKLNKSQQIITNNKLGILLIIFLLLFNQHIYNYNYAPCSTLGSGKYSKVDMTLITLLTLFTLYTTGYTIYKLSCFLPKKIKQIFSIIFRIILLVMFTTTYIGIITISPIMTLAYPIVSYLAIKCYSTTGSSPIAYKKLKNIFEENKALNQYNQIIFKYKLNISILALLMTILAVIISLCQEPNYGLRFIIFLAYCPIYNLIYHIHLTNIATHKNFITNLPNLTKFQQIIVNSKTHIYIIIIFMLFGVISSFVNYCACHTIGEPLLYAILIESKISLLLTITILLIVNIIHRKFPENFTPLTSLLIYTITFITYIFIYSALVSKFVLIALAYPIVSYLVLLYYKTPPNTPTPPSSPTPTKNKTSQSSFEENKALNQYNQISFTYKSQNFLLSILIIAIIILILIIHISKFMTLLDKNNFNRAHVIDGFTSQQNPPSESPTTPPTENTTTPAQIEPNSPTSFTIQDGKIVSSKTPTTPPQDTFTAFIYKDGEIITNSPSPNTP